MPKSSETTNAGPSSGSVLSFMAELTKCLSPVLSTRTTEEVDKLKRGGHLTTIKKTVARLINGDKVVPDCGFGYPHIPLRILGWIHNKNGKPQLNPEICFLIKEIEPASMSDATISSLPLEKLETPDDVFDITVSAYIPGKVHVTEFTLKQCTIKIPGDEAFVSLNSLRRVTDVADCCKLAQCSFIAHNFMLAVRTDHFLEIPDCYGFAIYEDDTKNFVSEEILVSAEAFKSTLN